jgi:hypothetical protein
VIEVDSQHRSERLSHALYGLIIITATLAAERAHVEEVGEALALLLTTALVLVLAHTYSAFMAERALEGKPLTAVARRLVVADNLPVVSAVVVPGVLFLVAGIGWIELSVAFGLSIGFTIAALFALGMYEAHMAEMRGIQKFVSGIGAAAIGLLIVGIEAFFD